MTTGKPNKVTFLSPNRPIGANINKGFVDTFNWLVRFCNNLQGDGYYITVQNELGDQPTITWGDTPPGEGSGSTYTPTPQPFDPIYTDGVISGFSNCVFCAERQFVDCGTMTISATASSIGYVVLTLTHPTGSNTYFSSSSASLSIEGSSINSYLNDNDTITKIPLFHITNGVVDLDLRNVPTGVLAR